MSPDTPDTPISGVGHYYGDYGGYGLAGRIEDVAREVFPDPSPKYTPSPLIRDEEKTFVTDGIRGMPLKLIPFMPGTRVYFADGLHRVHSATVRRASISGTENPSLAYTLEKVDGDPDISCFLPMERVHDDMAKAAAQAHDMAVAAVSHPGDEVPER